MVLSILPPAPRFLFPRPMLLLGGVADALNEALLVVRGAQGMSAARAAEACDDALKLLKKELKDVHEMQEMQKAQEMPSTGDETSVDDLELD